MYAKLFDAQRKAADFTIDHIKDGGGVCLFCQQRTGKTYITAAVIERLRPQLTLIVAPLTTLDLAWSPVLGHLPGTLTRDAQELTEAFSPLILLIHPEYFTRHAKRLLRHAWDLVVIDESQGIKDRNSQRSRAARKFRLAKRRLALSGTPIDSSEIDVWAQMRFVDCGVFGEDWQDFANEYCKKSGFMGHEWQFRKEKHAQFLKALENHIYRLTIDFMRLDPVNLIPIPVIMLGSQETFYHQMDRDSIITVNGVTIAAPLAVTRDVKKAQITGGFILDEDHKSFHIGSAKERKLKWLLARIKKPVVIFCQFIPEIRIIADSLKKNRVGILYGHVKKGRTQLLRDFQSGRYDVLICQVRTGGVGIDLTRSSNLIFYSFSHSYIDFEQILFRLQGLNQSGVVNAYILYCVESIDEDKMNTIKDKKSVAFKIVSHFERGRRHGEESSSENYKR